MRARALVLAGACTLALASRASAKPPLWERTRDPKLERSESVLRSIGRMIDDAREAQGEPDTLQNFRLGTLAMAELSGAHAFDAPSLLLVLGHVLLDANVGRDDEATRLAERLLERVDLDDRWLEAEARVLEARAARGSPERALDAVTRALPLVWEASKRSTLLRERAQARMALGDVRRSAGDQRAALLVADRDVDRALARFGLGLALERSGDLPSALAELRLAQATAPRGGSTDLSVLDLSEAFLFRPFDVHYVAALTSMAVAERAPERDASRVELERALIEWERFEISAPSDDPWLNNARLHRATSARRHDELLATRPPTPR